MDSSLQTTALTAPRPTNSKRENGFIADFNIQEVSRLLKRGSSRSRTVMGLMLLELKHLRIMLPCLTAERDSKYLDCLANLQLIPITL